MYFLPAKSQKTTCLGNRPKQVVFNRLVRILFHFSHVLRVIMNKNYLSHDSFSSKSVKKILDLLSYGSSGLLDGFLVDLLAVFHLNDDHASDSIMAFIQVHLAAYTGEVLRSCQGLADFIGICAIGPFDGIH